MSTIPPPNRDTTWGSFDRPTLAPSLRDYAAPAASNEPPRKSLILKQPLSRVHPFSTGARAVCLLRMTLLSLRYSLRHSLRHSLRYLLCGVLLIQSGRYTDLTNMQVTIDGRALVGNRTAIGGDTAEIAGRLSGGPLIASHAETADRPGLERCQFRVDPIALGLAG